MRYKMHLITLFMVLYYPISLCASFHKMEVYEILKGMNAPKYFIDPETKKIHSTFQFMNGIIEVESNDLNLETREKRVNDISYGPMQIRCKTAKYLGYVGECAGLKYTDKSLFYGVKYALNQLRKYSFNVKKAASSYNAGKYTNKNKKYVKKVLVFLSYL